MALLLALLAGAAIMHGPQKTLLVTSIGKTCPWKAAEDEVCVFTEGERILAVNAGSRPVKIVLQIQRIENVEVTYRYPFVDQIPAGKSKELINFKIKSQERPWALDYDWWYGHTN